MAIEDAGVGVVLRPRIATGFVRLSAAFESQGRYADAVRACYLVRSCPGGWWLYHRKLLCTVHYLVVPHVSAL